MNRLANRVGGLLIAIPLEVALRLFEAYDRWDRRRNPDALR